MHLFILYEEADASCKFNIGWKTLIGIFNHESTLE